MNSEPQGVNDPRFLTLTGTLNTRDLGGLPVAGGGVTRSGVFYRSDVPMELSDADLARLAGLGLRTVIDLRQPYELERDPTGLVGRVGLELHNVEIWGLIEEGNNEPADRYDITALYIAALDHAGAGLAQAVKLLAQSDGALLFHCTAGKDRTGLVAALVLEAVGVDRDTIVHDFALTHDRIGPLRERLLADAEKNGVPRSDFGRLLGATPDLIGPALTHLAEQHGGAVAYLRRHGVTDAELARLRKKLVVDPS